MNRLSFEMSADARLIYQLLKSTAVGDTVSYAAMSEHISRNVEGSTTALTTARRRALRDDDMVFGVVRGLGLRRLTDAQIVDNSVADVRKVRRAARYSAVKLTKVAEFDKMLPKAQLEHTARLSVLVAIADLASEKSVKKVEAAASGRASELPIAETIKAFLT